MGWTCKKLKCNETSQLLPDTPLLSAYLKHACKEQKHFFPLRNLRLITVFLVLLLDYTWCVFYLTPSTRPWTKQNQWRPLQNIWWNLWYRNIRKFLPSNTITKRSQGIPFNLPKQHANNTQIFIKCYYCNKPRLIFLNWRSHQMLLWNSKDKHWIFFIFVVQA